MKNLRKWFLIVLGIGYPCVLLLLILSLSEAHAGAPVLEETCVDSGKRHVPIKYDTSLQFFAEARLIAKAEQKMASDRGMSIYVIYINPSRYFLDRYTQQWLYLRQCAHITLKHSVIPEGMHGLKIEDEQRADCQAIREMQSSPGFSTRQIYSIERDIERLSRENRWGQVLAGPQRRISLESCK
jgi:hypothetical protein